MPRPTCCPFRLPTRTGSRRPARRSCSAMSCSLVRPSCARRRSSASRSPIIFPTSSCMAFCICSASITRAIAKPLSWKRAKSRYLRGWGFRRRMTTPCDRYTDRFYYSMSDSDPPEGDGQYHRHQTRNGGGSLARLRNLLRLLRRPAARGPEAAMEALIAAADLDGEIRITPQERFLIGNILKVHERNAGDVMVPRVDIVALEIDQPFSEVVKCMVEHGHSRVPIYRETLDDVIGFIHVKDVLAPVADRRPARLEGLLRKVLYVAPSLPILDLLVQMRQARTHIAMVVDEFGGIDGLVTIEDLIEEVVGEIEDEHDVPETPTLIERPDGSIIADARIPIDSVEEQHGISLRPQGDDETVETLGGLVFTLAGRVPKRGEIIAHPDGLEFEVLDADPRRVKRLRLRGLQAAAGKGVASA